MTFLNANVTNILTNNSKEFLHNPFLNMLLPLINRYSMDTKGPIKALSQNISYIHVIVDTFNHFVNTVPIKSNNAKTAVKLLSHHLIIKFGRPIDLVTDRGSEYIDTDMAQLCTLMAIPHSPRTRYSPWTVEVENKNLGTHLRWFLQNTPKEWVYQVHMYAYATIHILFLP